MCNKNEILEGNLLRMTPRSNFCHYDIQSTSSVRKISDDVFDDDVRDDSGSIYGCVALIDCIQYLKL